MTDDERTEAANGPNTTNGRPNGASTITPFLAVRDAAAAIAFYRDVFGARVLDTTEMGGVVVHSELLFERGRLQVGEAVPDYHLVPQPDGDDVSCSFGLYCPDVDAVVARATAAGAVLREPPSTFVSGDRYASIRDPFGVRWSVMTRVEDLADEESAERVRAWAASFE